MEPKYLYVFAGNRGQPIFQIFHRDRPSKARLREMPQVLHERLLSPA